MSWKACLNHKSDAPVSGRSAQLQQNWVYRCIWCFVVMNQRADASGVGACNHCRAAAMPIAAPKWRLWTNLYWMRLCSMRRQQAGRLKFAIRSRKGGTWRGLPRSKTHRNRSFHSRTAQRASRINSQDDCWVCPNSMAMRAYSGGFSSPAIHPALSDFIGSVATVTVIKRSHFAHSKLRKSYPVAPGSVRLRLIRFAHLGQRGRSIGRSDGLGQV
jgi:hypothetical protein